MNNFKLFGKALLYFAVATAAIFLATYLWNFALVPAVNGVNQVSFWQMLGIMGLWYILYPGTKQSLTTKN